MSSSNETSGLNKIEGRLYWLMDYLYTPYEYKSVIEIKDIISKNGFRNFRLFDKGVESDQIEQDTTKIPHVRENYGESQIKTICNKN